MPSERDPSQPAPWAGRRGDPRLLFLEQAHTDEATVAVHALDHVSAEPELGHDRGRKVDAAGVQVGEGDRLTARGSQPRQKPLLLRIAPLDHADSVPRAEAVKLAYPR